MGWGGKREGAGRKPLAGEPQKQRGLRATDEDWLLIKQFEKILKYGDKEAAKNFIAAQK